MKYSIIYIVDYGKLEWQSICLATSIRAFIRDADYEIIAYCPKDRIDGLEEITLRAHRELGVEIRPLDTSSNFSPDYPHGNKILACAEPRDSDFCIFMDTDMVLVRPTMFSELLQDGHFCAARETNARWPRDLAIWDRMYAANAPTATRNYSVFSNSVFAPAYYNAGFFGFDDRPIPAIDNKRFGERWLEVAYQVDADPEVSEKRPFLDQITLPVAVAACGLIANELSSDYNMHIRFEPESGPSVRILHYHSNMHGHLLRESRYFGLVNQLLNHFGMALGFADLVDAFRPYLSYVGIGQVFEIETESGTRYAQITHRAQKAHVLTIFDDTVENPGENLEAVVSAQGVYGMIDVAPNLYAKKLKLIGHQPVDLAARPGVWFWHDEPVEGRDSPERWVWNCNNSWRAANRDDIDMTKVPERRIETFEALLARRN